MAGELKKLVEISRYYGQNKDFIIAGGGNTSYKNDKLLYIKASGISLSDIDENGFCVLDRKKLDEIEKVQFSSDPAKREDEVKNALLRSRTDNASGLRPSVETSLHNIFSYCYVVHTHSNLVNGLMCSNDAAGKCLELFGEEALFVSYSDPGYTLFTLTAREVSRYKKKFSRDPNIVFIQNHGVFVAADSTEEIKNIYDNIIGKLKKTYEVFPVEEELPVSEKMAEIIPALRMLLSENRLKSATVFNSSSVNRIVADKASFLKSLPGPFTPDQIVYCLSGYVFVDNTDSAETVISEAKAEIEKFKSERGVLPKVIFIKGEGAVVAEDSTVPTGYLKDIVIDFCRISRLSENFGGPHPIPKSQVAFIESWEVENYRKKVTFEAKSQGRLENKTVIITGAAQGFGAGIAHMLFDEGANIVVADLNEEKGRMVADSLNDKKTKNRAFFTKVDVGEGSSVEQMVNKTVMRFGGIDVLISNAGILYAGSLDEMDQSTFQLMTKVNYTGYFLCTKYVQKIMKIQHHYKADHFMDIIQINSKSGLKGSNKNFAYAGGKFGGIGLTQSFALELMPFNIKVNAVCPGNFFDGPLWSDPEKGLFVQYLNTRKVPGARTINEVKAFYESQVPARRGCKPEDVVKAVLYLIDQQYETGQAVPVTGGQNMLR